MLWMTATANGYACPIWMTYKQAQELGAQVRKGEHGALVVYADQITRTEPTDKGEEVEREIPFMKGYTVFNVRADRRLAGAFLRHRSAAALTRCNASTMPRDSWRRPEPTSGMAETGLTTCRPLRLRADAAVRDLPGRGKLLRDPCARAARTGPATRRRLNREFGRKRWGDEGYAAEELVAELGSAFLCADLGLTPEPRADHASYIENWLMVLKNDKRAIFTAAAHAEGPQLSCMDCSPRRRRQRKPTTPEGRRIGGPFFSPSCDFMRPFLGAAPPPQGHPRDPAAGAVSVVEVAQLALNSRKWGDQPNEGTVAEIVAAYVGKTGSIPPSYPR